VNRTDDTRALTHDDYYQRASREALERWRSNRGDFPAPSEGVRNAPDADAVRGEERIDVSDLPGRLATARERYLAWSRSAWRNAGDRIDGVQS
jgi:hypothetical protein